MEFQLDHQEITTTSPPQVSVILPVYNQERYVAAAVTSILNQTFRNFEIIAIDDGSTDRTRDILYSVSDPRLRVRSLSHVGFLGALQAGVEAARGRWIARMDSDDVTHPCRLERQMSFLSTHEECVLVGSIYGIVTPNDKFLTPSLTFDYKYISPRDITVNTRLFADPSVLFDRLSSLEVGLYDPEFENENPLWYKLMSRGSAAVLGEPLHFLRWRLGSHSRTSMQDRYNESKELRQRYDPSNFINVHESYPEVTERSARLTAASRAIDYYLMAGDWQAARDAALTSFRSYPTSRKAAKLVIKALARRRSLRLAHPVREHRPFRAVPQPW